MKKTIYVPDDGTWERVEAAAAERNISISKLLLSSWVDSGMRLLDCDRLDRDDRGGVSWRPGGDTGGSSSAPEGSARAPAARGAGFHRPLG